jgi:serine/threonine protein kinase
MRQIADYQLTELLGQGASGSYYTARPPARLNLDVEWVAVKVLDRDATDDDFRRFANELKIFASVESSYLVGLHDAGHQDGRLYYATEYFPLGSLDQPAVTLSVDDMLRAVADAARGAHALHEVGVAHRDIKPGNILLVEDGARLADLGLAQVLDPGLTITGTGPLGPLEYMPPAIARGQTAGRATDIWALGAVLHHALTGMSVYGDIPTNSVLGALRHITDTPPQVDDSLEPAQAVIVEQCLAVHAEDRPLTAEQLAEDIEALL